MDDLIESFLRLMHNSDDLAGRVILGNAGKFNMIALTEGVEDLSGSRSVMDEILPRDDPKQRQPHITQSGQQRGWAPKALLREGLVPTIACFDRMPNAQ